MTFIQQITDQYANSSDWQHKYPWFSTGHLVAAAGNRDKPEFEAAAQKAAVFMNSIPRLHWLLNQPDRNKEQYLLKENTPEETLPPATTASPVLENEQLPVVEVASADEGEEAVPSMPQPTFSTSLAAAADSFKKDTDAEDPLLFETAYQHTIDYFASQGIRLEGEPAHDDRFGQQLKTFTSWLRQMKRLPDTTIPDSETLVETHAAHSLQKGEVLTEAMVDILVKQGKKQQAVLVLEKLRLLHPEKSLYFAARSEQIKHSK